MSWYHIKPTQYSMIRRPDGSHRLKVYKWRIRNNIKRTGWKIYFKIVKKWGS